MGLGIFVGVYLAGLAVLSFATLTAPERQWWSALNLYLPQHLWLLPGVLALGAAWSLRRRLVVLPALALAWTAGPLMGWCWNVPLPPHPATGAPRLRVMTYNVKWGRLSEAVRDEIASANPDLLLLQDAGYFPATGLQSYLSGWNQFSTNQYLIASRHPLTALEQPPFPPPDKEGGFLMATLQWGDTRVRVGSVHLRTPRSGLTALKEREGDSREKFQANCAYRLLQARTVAARLRTETGPLVMAGDLNAPVQSLACQALFQTGLRDAFSAAGWGYGYTYGHTLRPGLSYVRIDHILVSPHWRVERCWAGGAEGSDHRPVIADLSLQRE